MALQKYVDPSDYADADYFLEWNDVAYLEPDYVDLGYVASVIDGVAALTSRSSLTTDPVKVKPGQISVTSQATFTAQAVKVFGAESLISARSEVSATVLRIEPNSLTAFSAITVSASAGKIFGSQIAVTSQATVSATVLRIKPAAVSLISFNTVVAAAGRIRPAVDIIASFGTFTASAGKIFGVQTNTIDKYTPTPMPIPGVKVEFTAPDGYSGLQLDYREYYSYRFSLTFTNTVITWYSRSYNASSGTIFSWAGDGLNLAPIRVIMSGNSLKLDQGSGGVTFNNIPDTTELHHYALAVIDRYTGVTELYVDGIRQTNKTGSFTPDGQDWSLHATMYIGRYRTIQNFGSGGQNDFRVVQSNNWDGELAQVWIGVPSPPNQYGDQSQYTRITGYTRLTFQTFGPYGNLSDSQQITIGAPPEGPGTGTPETLSQPSYYIEYNDANISTFTPGTLNRLYYAAYPLQGNFTLTAVGYNIQDGVVSLNSRATIRAVLGFLQSSNFSCVSRATLTATPTNFTPAATAITARARLTATNFEFTKVSATLTSRFSLSADIDEIANGVSLVVSRATLTAQPTLTRRAATTVTSRARLIADGTTNQIVSSTLNSRFLFTATPYNFTPASVAVTSRAAISGDARIFSPPRGTVNMSSRFALTVTPLKLRIQSVVISARASVLLGNGNALRSGSVTMRAFDTVLSIGNLIEFLRENSIAVTEEQRLLRVSLESTVLLVEMANGVNTVMAETRDIQVESATGVLLAQHNIPHY